MKERRKLANKNGWTYKNPVLNESELTEQRQQKARKGNELTLSNGALRARAKTSTPIPSRTSIKVSFIFALVTVCS